MVRGFELGVALGSPVLQAKDDAEHDNHHDQKGAIVLASATALIGITNLWQKYSYAFQGRCGFTARLDLMVNGEGGDCADRVKPVG